MARRVKVKPTVWHWPIRPPETDAQLKRTARGRKAILYLQLGMWPPEEITPGGKRA